nr:GNAT family N-acetyltransferase [Oscillochloris trichoides]
MIRQDLSPRASWHVDLIDHHAPSWPNELASLWHHLGAPHNPELLPDHFVQTTFVKMGGRVLRLRDERGLRGAALLFPRGTEGSRSSYTLRYTLARTDSDADASEPAHITPRLSEILGSQQIAPSITLHHPSRARSYYSTDQRIGEFSIGAPGPEEVAAIRAMHMQIWGTGPGGLYPDDLHSAEFGPATSLVARVGSRVVGFLLGFYRFGGLEGLERAGMDTSLCIESQVMGVDPGLRRAGLAATLKRAQASDALAKGIEVIHWTADPLQFANATLNFHKLRAVAGEFYPAYYPFKNQLNRVSASRFGITWMPNTAWGRAGMLEGPRRDRSLARFPDCAILNAGLTRLRTADGAAQIAIEIPADWTALQAEDLDASVAWRSLTDTIFAEVIGYTPGRYLIADVASAGNRHYLIGYRSELVLAGG